jgi:AraC-like DNA-binding protein
MILTQIDIAVRVAGATLLLLLAGLLYRQRRAIGMPARLFLPLALCLSGFLLGNTSEGALRPAGALGSAARFASGLTVVFLWWFCLACFDRRFRPRGAVLVTGLAWAALAVADRILAAPGLTNVLVAIGFAIVGHLVWQLVAAREGDLVEPRRAARTIVAGVLGGLLLVDLSVDLVFGFAWRPWTFAMSQNLAILGFAAWLATRLLVARPGVLSFEERGGEPAATAMPAVQYRDRSPDPLRQRLEALILIDKLHLDPELTFAALVQRMGAPERAVRRLINDELGYDHFRSFLAHHRVEEACRRLAEPGRAGDKLIAIALDSGFASLASFNRVFRAEAGCTPSAYRAAALARTAPSAANSPPAPGFEERSAVF